MLLKGKNSFLKVNFKSQFQKATSKVNFEYECQSELVEDHLK
jgi:hypothetical protein